MNHHEEEPEAKNPKTEKSDRGFSVIAVFRRAGNGHQTSPSKAPKTIPFGRVVVDRVY